MLCNYRNINNGHAKTQFFHGAYSLRARDRLPSEELLLLSRWKTGNKTIKAKVQHVQIIFHNLAGYVRTYVCMVHLNIFVIYCFTVPLWFVIAYILQVRLES